MHFGEVEAAGSTTILAGRSSASAPGEPPYPETMNRGAVGEMAAADLAAVIVKGDLTNDGTADEFAAFESCYRDAFGDRLHVVRGNHDAYKGQDVYAGDEWIDLPGVSIALLDTVRARTHVGWHHAPSSSSGSTTMSAAADRPVVVMGHHQQWISGKRHSEYFGLDPDSSDGLAEVAARRPRIIAYTAGHTHRHRVRLMSCGVPSIEVGCVKDFPGTWAEYRVYEGGITQVVHRMSSPEALGWSERCRHLYGGLRDRLRDVRAGQLGGPVLQHPAAVRAAFEDAAASLLTTVERVEPHQWELPGLGEWTVRELTAHTLRAFSTIERYLAAEPSVDRLIVDAADYFRVGLADPKVHARSRRPWPHSRRPTERSRRRESKQLPSECWRWSRRRPTTR